MLFSRVIFLIFALISIQVLNNLTIAQDAPQIEITSWPDFDGDPQTEVIYWRDFVGYIPADAIVGAEDENGTSIYIAQTVVVNNDLLYVPTFGIKMGDTEIYVPVGNIVALETVPGHLKILCGTQQSIYWLQTNRSTLQEVIDTKYPVLGGFYFYSGEFFIGRRLDSSGVIGRIQVEFGEFCTANATLTQCYRNDYEVLLFK